MPLSEHEQQVIAELERSLRDDDIATGKASSPRPRSVNGRLFLVVAGMFLGLGVLAFGAVTGTTIVGVAGFTIMFITLTWAVAQRTKKVEPEVSPLLAISAEKDFMGTNSFEASSNFMAKIEDRWNRRQDGEVA